MTACRYIDLHTHSTASDGSDTPAAVITKAHAAGLAAVALTDHDTLDGLDEAAETAGRLGVELVRGCELGAMCPYGEVHILGLWLPETPKALLRTLAELRQGRHDRNVKIVDKLRALGMNITYDEVRDVAGEGSVGRPHIAQVLVQKQVAGSTRQAFDMYLGDRGAAYVPRKSLSPEGAVKALKAEGATVSFAHPMLINAPDDWLEETVASLTAAGLDAIEAYHSEHSQKDIRRCVELADRYGLALTGGSDYHGSVKPDISLGTGKGGLRVPYLILEKLKAARTANGLPV
ncbi:PHP domain protein [Oleidesulfovibrio alaskensis G20]|jgi:predicted metal-dependent phosphoesterase TrpH|uniref:PHP domain protein n=1 Tax=Oleidesulfovibrio alaskensis (strain ATCC BAA-1058 / DSM 17464 / G20) TaxID=207559 RepID=Q30WQ8_OLEA2|nr:PHP domain-containing protein [Oleidesulfovibrio alaskensis]ABB39888.1 PHP domain protein [Oleidesulfovibrio alaskensis G20]MBG0773605.1 PHP domain-containing protein [Oleidesulfovibrio alaskensis]